MKVFKIFSFLVCLLPGSVHAGELDGKTLSCFDWGSDDDWMMQYFGWKFDNGFVEMRRLFLEESKVSVVGVTPEVPTPYRASLKTVSWWENGWVLRRDSLILVNATTLENWQCEVIEEEVLEGTLEKLAEIYQTHIDEIQTSNKI